MSKCNACNSLQVLPKNIAQLQADPEAHASDLHFLCTAFDGIKKKKGKHLKLKKTISN